MAETYWCEALQAGDKVIVKSTGYYDTPRVRTITRTTSRQVFLCDGPMGHEWAFWKETGRQVRRGSSLHLRLSQYTEDAARAVEQQQHIEAIKDFANSAMSRMRGLESASVQELYDCLMQLVLIKTGRDVRKEE